MVLKVQAIQRTKTNNNKYWLFCNIWGTLDKMCGNIVFPPKAQAILSKALSDAIALLETKFTLAIISNYNLSNFSGQTYP